LDRADDEQRLRNFLLKVEPARQRVVCAAPVGTHASLRDKLLKPKIGRLGQLQEWEEDKDNPKDDHRHVSHLFALHPGRQITKAGTPA
jgi:hypothetical protein